MLGLVYLTCHNYICSHDPCKSVCDLSPSTINVTGIVFTLWSFWQYLFLAGIQASPVCTSRYFLLHVLFGSTSPKRILYPSAKFLSVISVLSVKMLIIISLVSNTGTVTIVPMCSLTLIFFGCNPCVEWVSCIDLRKDFQDFSFAYLLKVEDQVYSVTRWQISSYIYKLALCFMIISCSITWNLITAVVHCNIAFWMPLNSSSSIIEKLYC